MESNDYQLMRWQSSLEGFSEVWSRVHGSAETDVEPRPGPGASLRDMAAEAERAADYDRTLAGRFRGDGRTLLLRHACQAEIRAKRLRAEVFLADGTQPLRGESCPCAGNRLVALRSSMLRDESASRAYAAAARRVDGELRTVLTAYADETKTAAEEKRRLIRRCFA